MWTFVNYLQAMENIIQKLASISRVHIEFASCQQNGTNGREPHKKLHLSLGYDMCRCCVCECVSLDNLHQLIYIVYNKYITYICEFHDMCALIMGERFRHSIGARDERMGEPPASPPLHWSGVMCKLGSRWNVSCPGTVGTATASVRATMRLIGDRPQRLLGGRHGLNYKIIIHHHIVAAAVSSSHTRHNTQSQA